LGRGLEEARPVGAAQTELAEADAETEAEELHCAKTADDTDAEMDSEQATREEEAAAAELKVVGVGGVVGNVIVVGVPKVVMDA